MPIVKRSLGAGNELTHEEHEAAHTGGQTPLYLRSRLPPLTEEQLAGFRPGNFAGMEERARCMEAMSPMKRPSLPPDIPPGFSGNFTSPCAEWLQK